MDRRPGKQTIVRSTLALMLAVAALPGVAQAAPLQRPAGGRAQLDVRVGERTPIPAATRAARTTLAEHLGIESQVATDPVGGGLRSLGRTDGFLTGPRAGDPATIALDYVRVNATAFGLTDTQLAAMRLARRYRALDGVTHLTWVPMSHGIPAYDSELAVHVTRDGRVIAASGPPLGGVSIASAAPRLSASQALGIARNDVGARAGFPAARTQPGPQRVTTFANGDRASLVVLDTPSGDRLAWRLTVTGKGPYMYDEVVDADTGAMLVRHSLTDFAVSHADVFSYHPGAAVGGTATQVDLGPWLTSATTLSGPFAHAFADPSDDGEGTDGTPVEIPPSSGADWIYPQTLFAPAGSQFCSPFGGGSGICTWNGTLGSEATNRNQVTTQIFYYVNNFHDWLAQPPIGFTNASRNFEVGGLGGSDPVKAESDDSILGTDPQIDNANMSTPPDGQSPRMQMYLFGFGFPAVNGGDDASVVYHEYTHGLSNRLIGNGDGLNDNQPRAMGEGWSDWYAMDYLASHGPNGFNTSPDFVPDTAANGEVVVGEYATGDTVHGIRHQALDCPVGASAPACPGSTNAGHSGGFTYADLGRVGGLDASTPEFEVHDDGEIWSETLWDLRTALGPATARELITDGMRDSPTDPSYLDERDAILQADLTDFGGAHHNQIWQVFATRGMGFGARTTSPNATHGLASFATPTLASVASTAVTEAAAPLANDDGVVDPGEALSLDVALRDPGLAGLTNVHGTLSSATPGVSVTGPDPSYGSLGAAAVGHGTFTVTMGRSLACGALIPFTLHVTSDQGTVDLPVSVVIGAGRTTFASTDVPQAIPDASANGNPNGGADSTLTIPSSGRVDRLRVTLTLAHTWAGDLQARLTSPAGTSIDLFEHPGLGSDDGSGFGGFSNVTFDDDATQSIQEVPFANHGSAVSGLWTPDEPLSKFAGEDRAGTWTLHVADEFQGDVGTIQQWGIETDQVSCTPLPLPPVVTPPAPAGPSSAGPPSPSPPAPAVKPAVYHATTRATLDRHNRYAFAFLAAPAGLKGTLRVVLPKHGRAKALLFDSARFTTSRSGRVRLVLMLRGSALKRLRALHAAKLTVTISLGGRTFSSTLRLAAPPPPRHRKR